MGLFREQVPLVTFVLVLNEVRRKGDRRYVAYGVPLLYHLTVVTPHSASVRGGGGGGGKRWPSRKKGILLKIVRVFPISLRKVSVPCVLRRCICAFHTRRLHRDLRRSCRAHFNDLAI